MQHDQSKTHITVVCREKTYNHYEEGLEGDRREIGKQAWNVDDSKTKGQNASNKYLLRVSPMPLPLSICILGAVNFCP